MRMDKATGQVPLPRAPIVKEGAWLVVSSGLPVCNVGRVWAMPQTSSFASPTEIEPSWA